MKKKSLNDSKLSLNKKAISKLDDANLENIQGGITFTCCTKVTIEPSKPKEEAFEDGSVHYSCG
ncbi:hypothetical protein SAMN05421820_101213 [Pedobacter steynii]|uniref:Uncharacterized protein n=1 Tax=Pedobacter steynii TaxID=430522 RepID=A0A1G9JCR1_9SPHI|nr:MULTISPECIES: class I lanthipeptide [Pedobacter]NQX38204.1 hypothetical protein [Pedobacter steynii]RQO69846.1 hypothetical protein DBR43_17485 [Pedobacter sp. KBW06]SDL34904.1 hypothetical protein SAMN05421820_101213 [Pedobacter steynii]